MSERNFSREELMEMSDDAFRLHLKGLIDETLPQHPTFSYLFGKVIDGPFQSSTLNIGMDGYLSVMRAKDEIRDVQDFVTIELVAAKGTPLETASVIAMTLDGSSVSIYYWRTPSQSMEMGMTDCLIYVLGNEYYLEREGHEGLIKNRQERDIMRGVGLSLIKAFHNSAL